MTLPTMFRVALSMALDCSAGGRATAIRQTKNVHLLMSVGVQNNYADAHSPLSRSIMEFL
jgi:hypothetical protein